MDFVVYQSTEDVAKMRTYAQKVADHFGSELLAGQFMDGLIDWDGNPLCDVHGSRPCHCFDLDCM